MQRKPKPGPATAEFNDLVEKEMRRYPPPTRQQAVRNVSVRYPALLAKAQAEHCPDPKTAAAIASGSSSVHTAVPRQVDQAKAATTAVVKTEPKRTPVPPSLPPTRQAKTEAAVPVATITPPANYANLSDAERFALLDKLRGHYSSQGIVAIDQKAIIAREYPGLDPDGEQAVAAWEGRV